MGKVTVAVFLTQEAQNHDPDMASKIARYLNSTFKGVPDEVNVARAAHNPNPPTERTYVNFTDTVCGQREYYPHLLDWWNDYHPCHNLYSADDSNILVTNDTGLSGRAGLNGRFAVAAGSQIASLGSGTRERGCSTGLDAMQTVIHEIGHNLGLRHNDGFRYAGRFNNNYYETHMINGYHSINTNSCGTSLDEPRGTHCHNMNWSNCASGQIQT